MYDSCTQVGVARTNHRSLVGMGGGRLSIRDKGLAHTHAHTFLKNQNQNWWQFETSHPARLESIDWFCVLIFCTKCELVEKHKLAECQSYLVIIKQPWNKLLWCEWVNPAIKISMYSFQQSFQTISDEIIKTTSLNVRVHISSRY